MPNYARYFDFYSEGANRKPHVTCGFPLVLPYRRSEGRQIGDPQTTFGHYFTQSGPPRDCLDLFIPTMTPWTARERSDKRVFNARGAEARERGKLLGDIGKNKTPKKKWFFLRQVQIKSPSFDREGGPGVFGGMDTHIKEGQLYVQHQKFGKVSPRNKEIFDWYGCGVVRNDQKRRNNQLETS